VHPAKAEVRFRSIADVELVIETAVREALAGSASSATLDQRPQRPQLRRPEPSLAAAPAAGGAGQLAFFVPAPEPRTPGEADDETEVAADGGPAAEPGAARVATAEGRARPQLWQLHDTYILAETRSGLIIIDQHSAHERIRFEEIMAGFSAAGQPSQRLLFPLTLRLSPAEFSAVNNNVELFGRAGFEIEPFGGRTVIVHSAPNPHRYFDAERCLRDMLTELATGSDLTRAARNQHERIAMIFACKSSVKAGQKLSVQEMDELFERLFTTELPYHDVHGRPTIVRLSREELERRFGRHG
jgi:DNA mismatch repair protein MutL